VTVDNGILAELGSVYAEGLAAAIAKSGIKQSVIARELRTDPALVSGWTKVQRRVPARHLAPLTHLLSCSVDDLIGSSWHADVSTPANGHSGNGDSALAELIAVREPEEERAPTESADVRASADGGSPPSTGEESKVRRSRLQFDVTSGLPLVPNTLPTTCSCGKQVRP